MRLRFTKMQGAGNDFVMINSIDRPFALDSRQLRRLADRRFGVGADQVLVVEAADQPGIDFRYRIFNADGGEVEQCGNGARCFVRFVLDQRLTDKRTIRVSTRSGVIEPMLEDDGTVTVDMGAPRFEPAEVPFDPDGLVPDREGGIAGGIALWPLDVGGADGPRIRRCAVLSMGNPHAVQLVADVAAAAVADEGPRLETHVRFPRRVNAGFMQVVDRQRIRLRVWERGAGETLACGTGACAAAVTAIRRGLVDSPVIVEARGGTLRIAWSGAGSVLMSGPAQEVFEGEIEI